MKNVSKGILKSLKDKFTKTAQGFTLVELLVVVLIIGILSAVALPQYRLAVMKARFASMMPIVTALAQAQEVYYLENGEYADSIENLSIEPPGGGVISGASVSYYPKFSCRLMAQNVYCSGDDTGYYSQYLHHSSYPDQRFCVVYNVADGIGEGIKLRKKLCASYGSATKTFSSGEWDFYAMP
ncbi:type IV pilin protein [Candidatus Avelusimicrobium sp.]